MHKTTGIIKILIKKKQIESYPLTLCVLIFHWKIFLSLIVRINNAYWFVLMARQDK
jgi:O-antigen ligase